MRVKFNKLFFGVISKANHFFYHHLGGVILIFNIHHKSNLKYQFAI